MTQSNELLNEQYFYQMLDKYRENRRTSALTTYDIQTFIEKNPEYNIEPIRVLKHIIMGNACAWRPYEVAYEYYRAHKDSMQSLIEGISSKRDAI